MPYGKQYTLFFDTEVGAVAGRVSSALIHCWCNEGAKERRVRWDSVSDLDAQKLLTVWVATGEPGV